MRISVERLLATVAQDDLLQPQLFRVQIPSDQTRPTAKIDQDLDCPLDIFDSLAHTLREHVAHIINLL